MQSFIIIKGGYTHHESITIPIDATTLDILRASTHVEVRFRPLSPSDTGARQRFYYGIYIPNVIQRRRELSGVLMSEGEVDLLNRKEANNGEFTVKVTDNGEAIIFKDLHISRMTRPEFNQFINNCDEYWRARGIDPVTDNELCRD
jgi:hypothetical protein